MSRGDDRADRWARRAYALALHAFPEWFRSAWGGDMRATFGDRVAAARRARPGTPWRLVAREVATTISAGLRERVHSNARQLSMIHAQDIRYAFRLLFRTPGFTLLAVLVLAGGLGLSTFTFSFLYTAMLRPLPLGEGARIVRVDPVVDGRRTVLDAADVVPLRDGLTTIRELGAFGERDVVIGSEGKRRVVSATVAEPTLFGIARTPALLGRTLLASDAAPGAEPVIVLSYRTWDVVLGADRSLLDAQLLVDGVSTRVVGIMPEGFGFPVATEAWLPLPASTLTSSRPGQSTLRLAGRLAPGVSHARAAAEATPLLQRTLGARDSSVLRSQLSVAVESFPSAQFGAERTLVFTVLNLLAALILLLALVNVTNLLLARANERIRETAVRLALGASTGRLVMQGMWETVILVLIGGVVGTAGASWGLAAITRWTQANMQGNLAFWWVWQMDHVTLLCAGAFVTVTIVVLGSVVSLRTARTNVREVMQDGNARSGSRREGRLSRALVTTQVTTVTVLLFFGVLSGIMARRVVTLDPGFDVTNLMQAAVDLPEERYPDARSRASALRLVHERLAEQPSLAGVVLRRTLAEQRTPAGAFALRDLPAGTARPSAWIVAALGDLSTIDADLVEGRALHAADDLTRAPVVVISRSLALRHWQGRSPVGDQVQLAGMDDSAAFRTIVGVVHDIPYGDPLARDRSPDAIYVPLQQAAPAFAAIVLRHRGDELAAREALLQGVGAADPLLVPESVQPYAAVLEKVAVIATSVTRLFAACFAFALLLALAGSYGLMSRAIGLRTREIGVRRALGASDANVTRLLVGQGGRQLGVGALFAAPIMAGVALGFMHFFPISGWIALMAGVAVASSIVALVLLATWLPTRRVLRVTPRDALWTE
jgi:predicted permease